MAPEMTSEPIPDADNVAPLSAAALRSVLRWILPAIAAITLNGLREALAAPQLSWFDLALFGGMLSVSVAGFAMAMTQRFPRLLPRLVILAGGAYILTRLTHTLFVLDDVSVQLGGLPYTGDWIHVWMLGAMLLLPWRTAVPSLLALLACVGILSLAYVVGLGSTQSGVVTTMLLIRFIGINAILAILVTGLLRTSTRTTRRLAEARADLDQERTARRRESARRQLLERVAHGVRTPLNGLVHQLDLLRHRIGRDALGELERHVADLEVAVQQFADADEDGALGNGDEPITPDGDEPVCARWHLPVRVLVADDVETNLQVLSTLLRRRGIEVECASDGDEALDLLCTQPFDLAMLDIQMPGRSGPQVAEAARRTLGADAPPMVAVTATLVRWREQQALDAGMVRVIGKPVRLPDLDAIGILTGLATADDGATDRPEGGGAMPKDTASEIDVRQLRESCGDDPQMLELVLGRMPSRRASDLDATRTALAAGDADAAAQSLHRLVGFLATAGAVEAAARARTIEDSLGEPHDPDDVLARIDELDAAIVAAEAALRQEVTQGLAP